MKFMGNLLNIGVYFNLMACCFSCLTSISRAEEGKIEPAADRPLPPPTRTITVDVSVAIARFRAINSRPDANDVGSLICTRNGVQIYSDGAATTDANGIIRLDIQAATGDIISVTFASQMNVPGHSSIREGTVGAGNTLTLNEMYLYETDDPNDPNDP